MVGSHLFRAVSAETGKLVKGYLWSDRVIGVASPCGNIDEVVIIPETIQHCSGMEDIAGTWIFEGDTVRVTWTVAGREPVVKDFVCTFVSGCFMLSGHGAVYTLSTFVGRADVGITCEVVGVDNVE